MLHRSRSIAVLRSIANDIPASQILWSDAALKFVGGLGVQCAGKGAKRRRRRGLS
jgi:hypothetical protein